MKGSRFGWTILLWLSFIGLCVASHLFLFTDVDPKHPSLLDHATGIAVNFLMLILFLRFMYVRMEKLDNPTRSISCCRGNHDFKTTFSGTVMDGTGQFINGQEIMRERWETRWECQRPGCDYWDRSRT